jgi:chromosome segregation ATPase
MKFASLVLFAAGPLSVFLGPLAIAANDPSLAAEVTSLEKKLAAARDELAETKTALAISKAETEAAETRARARAGPDSQVDALRGQVRVLERDLQSATSALRRIAADKAATETALFSANEQLVAAGKPAVPPRGPLPTPPATSTSPDPRLAELQAQLVDVRSRLEAAEKTSAAREAELVKLRAAVAAAEARPAIPANITDELTALRAQTGAGRELETRLRALETENAAAITQMAEMERKLATANAALAQQTKDQDALRNQAARAGELESRLRQVQAEKIAAPVSSSPANGSPDELSRLTAARVEAENKLSTVLRSFTLLTRERDELRARLAELTKASGDSEKK